MVTIHGSIAHFSFFCPGAARVRLVGGPPRSPQRRWDMIPTREGYWLTQLTLPPGPFCFRYRAEGRWHIDPGEVGSRDRRTGWFSIIDVPGDSRAARGPSAAAGASGRPDWRVSAGVGRADG
jgi:hypothetical protein